jgi:thioredoxin-like negative regulator of GroEL
MTTTAQKTAKQPSDHKRKQSAAQKAKASARRAEASDEPISFVYDGDTWEFTAREATGLEFLAALEDEELVKACRLLLGHEQAARLFHGRSVPDLMGFFDAMGEAADSGNP